jgi:nitric oxide dioxygenase
MQSSCPHATHQSREEPAMLSDQNRPVVEATLPVVGEHIGEIARRFYQHLFGNHPELLDGTFNRGNQARGEQQQALAGSVAAFASTLVKTPERVPETCSPGSRTSTPRWASAPTSTRSSTTT